MRAGRAETYARFEGVELEDFDIIQNIITDPSYEVFGCVFCGSEDEGQAASDMYYHEAEGETGSHCTNYRELLVVYVYNGEFYIGSQIDWKIGY